MTKSEFERLEIMNPNIVHIIRQQIAAEIEAIPLGEENDHLNALGMRMLAVKVAKGEYH